MKQKSFVLIAVLALLPLFVGCSHDSGSSTTQTATTQPAKIPIPPDSPFAKIKVGMSEGQVASILGQPTSEGAYATGKNFIPFHFSGSDNVRKAMHYKGMGIIVVSNDSAYSSGYSVSDIEYDPNEQGY
jgi:outer membrane protein assembly factor BamE (lipoprotein component of BamABCDE complex)